MESSDPLVIGGVSIPRGHRKRLSLRVGKHFDQTDIAIPVEVIRGRHDGPVLFISAAIHGDEINGVEIIKRLLRRKAVNVNMHGTLICVPIVNVAGYNSNSRYLPDRRDLNRCFPGSEKGSLGGQIANIFMKEIVEKSTHGIDLHTGAIHRSNLPQIRASLDDEETNKLAQAFGVPVNINSSVRDGSLRECAAELGIPSLLYEAGEALRYDESAIRIGISGILSVMGMIGMIEPGKTRKKHSREIYNARSSYWIRAPHSGSLRVRRGLGSHVRKDEIIGDLSNPYGDIVYQVHVPKTGIIIGMTRMPLVNNGDALFHIATFEDSAALGEALENINQEYSDKLI